MPSYDMIADILASARPFAIPLANRFRGTDVREGLLLDGPASWAEFAPFTDYSDEACVPWLRAAVDTAIRNWPAPRRSMIEVNTTVPVVAPEAARAMVAESGCRTAKVKVGGPKTTRYDDAQRVAAVREALGEGGRIRVDANCSWSVDEALAAIDDLRAAAGELEYVEQPCRTVDELAEVRATTDVPIAADESIRLASDPYEVARRGGADIAVLKVGPLGGVWHALQIATEIDLPVVVSSAVDTSVGLTAGLALAGALPRLEHACGLGTASLLAGDVVDRPLTPQQGLLPVMPYAPPPSDVHLAQWCMSSERERYWRERLDRVASLAFG